jgi:release factor glutamine methyltransferase
MSAMISYSKTAELRQKLIFKTIREIPALGVVFRHLNVPLVVYKNVFIPCEDSIPLLLNYKVQKGERVLDVGTGSGVLAIFAALAGARSVVAVDWNEYAVVNARTNAKLYGLETVINVRHADVFDAIKEDEKFDVIIANLPFMNKCAADVVETSIWDSNLYANRKFFSGVRDFLAPGGRIYTAQADFGAVEEILKLARNAGLSMRRIGWRVASEIGSTFYAFELKRSV